MKIKLESDFRDFYDHCFASRHLENYDYILDRNSSNNISKLEQFNILSSLFYVPVKHGIVKELDIFNMDRDVVVYIDQYKHRGEGKVKLKYKTALNEYPDCLCSLYVDSGKVHSNSFRELIIGNHWFKLSYHNNDANEWRSNYGCLVDIKLENYGLLSNMQFSRFTIGRTYPIYAVDYVLDSTNKCFYVDFNTSPGIQGTGIEDVCNPSDIYSYIEKYVESYLIRKDL